MINEKLVQQVREGKASIWHTRERDDLHKIREILNRAFPEDKQTASGTSRYYFRSMAHNRWTDQLSMPTGLTPIPLDYFFKGEEEKIEHPQHPVKPVGKLWRYLPKVQPPHQSSLPSRVQTADENELLFFAQYLNQCFIERGAMTYPSIKDAITAWKEVSGGFNKTATPSLPPSEEKRVEAWQIDFGSHMRAIISFDGKALNVQSAIDGWGNDVSINEISIINLKTINNGKYQH